MTMSSNQAKPAVKIKVAVTMEEKESSSYLGELNMDLPLSQFIKGLCEHFKADHPEGYGLIYADPPMHYLSDQNRERIKVKILIFLFSRRPNNFIF